MAGRHLVDGKPIRRKILKPTPKIFGVTLTECTLVTTSQRKIEVKTAVMTEVNRSH